METNAISSPNFPPILRSWNRHYFCHQRLCFHTTPTWRVSHVNLKLPSLLWICLVWEGVGCWSCWSLGPINCPSLACGVTWFIYPYAKKEKEEKKKKDLSILHHTNSLQLSGRKIRVSGVYSLLIIFSVYYLMVHFYVIQVLHDLLCQLFSAYCYGNKGPGDVQLSEFSLEKTWWRNH